MQTNRLRRLIVQRMESVLEAADLTAAQWFVLSALHVASDATLTEISNATDYDAGGLSRAVYPLRERGLVNARPAREDRRCVVLSISPSGYALHASVESALAERIDEQLDTSVGRRDLEQMLELVSRAASALSPNLLEESTARLEISELSRTRQAIAQSARARR